MPTQQLDETILEKIKEEVEASKNNRFPLDPISTALIAVLHQLHYYLSVITPNWLRFNKSRSILRSH